ncbi:MAG: restriction endonuclease subunit S, partial [Weeksellaceae bacterium]
MSQTNIDIPQGYKQTKVGIIPEDWAVKNLASQVYIDKSNIKNDYDKEYINYVSLSDVENGIAHYNKIKFQEAPSRAKRIAPKYSVLFATVRPNLKNFGIVEDDGVVASTGFAVLEKKKANMKFIFNYLYSYQAERQFNALTVGSNYPALNSTDVKNLKLPIPPLPEQEKIADCLTIWDKAITQTKKLIDAKKQVKKGLMQQLLTGKKRLAGFTEEWKEVKLGEIGETFNGLTGKNKNDFGSGMPYVSYLNTYRNNKIDENTKFDYVNIKPTENQNRLMYGDLIFTTSSETPDEVGISSVILFEPTEYLYLNSFCFGLRLQDFSILEPKFAVFY